MIITCEVSCDMGYIYVMPPINHSLMNSGSNISDFYSEITLTIPYEKNENITPLLNRLVLSQKTYSEALNDGDLDQEYCNDRDESGYLTGIELNMSESEFINRIKANSYKVYEIAWRDKSFRMITFDTHEAVFNLDNFIYPLTDENDSFVIVKVERKYNIGLITALITYREDLYPTEYFKRPQFFLRGHNK